MPQDDSWGVQAWAPRSYKCAILRAAVGCGDQDARRDLLRRDLADAARPRSSHLLSDHAGPLRQEARGRRLRIARLRHVGYSDRVVVGLPQVFQVRRGDTPIQPATRLPCDKVSARNLEQVLPALSCCTRGRRPRYSCSYCSSHSHGPGRGQVRRSRGARPLGSKNI